MYTAIKEVQAIMTRLKKKPFYDALGNSNGDVYNHTLIYIVSDHGFSLTS